MALGNIWFLFLIVLFDIFCSSYYQFLLFRFGKMSRNLCLTKILRKFCLCSMFLTLFDLFILLLNSYFIFVLLNNSFIPKISLSDILEAAPHIRKNSYIFMILRSCKNLLIFSNAHRLVFSMFQQT